MDTSDDGPDLAPGLRETDNNLCGVLRGRLDVSAVAGHFVRAGWTSRSSSWDAYEVGTSWCRVDLDPAAGPDILLNGVIAPDRLDTLATLLSRFGLSFGLELYDDEGGLRREITA
ncbi:hypothetical protein [Streptomyces geranii]|uniref:hypothetical protein n=1 Tax=Streptomyces geranii TaxID=2058923 RepID=UPI000D04541E|nr:hypothetical protein [Streptomyces geranii]